MEASKTIRTAIIDDKQQLIDVLKDHLSFFPEIEVCGTASQHRQAGKLLANENLDLVFLDVEMPIKNGFELLYEARNAGAEFSVIFYTAYDKYVIKALRESAFDYILKPVQHDELKIVLDRYTQYRGNQSKTIFKPLFLNQKGSPEIVALPTYYGIQFMNINQILLFRSTKTKLLERSAWECILTDASIIKLPVGISAERILSIFLKDRFFQISQSCIINLSYLNIVEYKPPQCVLFPPYDKVKLTVSRTQLSKLKDRFDTI